MPFLSNEPHGPDAFPSPYSVSRGLAALFLAGYRQLSLLQENTRLCNAGEGER